MIAVAPAIENLSLNITEEIHVRSSLTATFAALLEEMGPSNEGANSVPMPMILEPWPGGRWFRDLGNNNGHLWGHVQAIKQPTLLEITGPLMMSFAVALLSPHGCRHGHAPCAATPSSDERSKTDSVAGRVRRCQQLLGSRLSGGFPARAWKRDGYRKGITAGGDVPRALHDVTVPLENGMSRKTGHRHSHAASTPQMSIRAQRADHLSANTRIT
jgi:hypothetical protein